MERGCIVPGLQQPDLATCTMPGVGAIFLRLQKAELGATIYFERRRLACRFGISGTAGLGVYAGIAGWRMAVFAKW